MIEDHELLLLFQAESEERIAHLKEVVHQLNETSFPSLLDTMLRDAHTLKGAARMLSFQDVSAAAAAFEELMDKLRQGSLKWHPNLAQEMLSMISDLERLVAGHVFQDSRKKDSPEQQEPLTQSREIGSIPSVGHLKPNEDFVSIVVRDLRNANANRFSSPTIRVAKEQIVELTKHAADLLVTQNKLTTFRDDIESIQHIIEQATDNLSIEWRGKYPVHWVKVLKEIEQALAGLRERTHENTFKLSSITSLLVTEIKSLGLLPFNKIFELFPGMVEDLARASGKEVHFNMEGGDITVDKKIIEEMKDPIMHILRNAISHGIEPPEQRLRLSKPRAGNITLRAQQISQTIIIDISDDGQGLDPDKIRKEALEKNLVSAEDFANKTHQEIYPLIFVPGFSTAGAISDISGRGVGLDVVREQVQRLQGTIQVESQQGQGCRFIIELPTTVLTTRVSIVQIYNELYAIPIEAIESVHLVSLDEIFQIHRCDVILYKTQPIPLHFLGNLLNVAPPDQATSPSQQNFKIPCIVLNVRGSLLALIIDAILDEQQVVLVPLKKLLTETPNFSGAATLKTGRVCLVVDPVHLVKSVKAFEKGMSVDKLKEKMKVVYTKKKALLVDDSYAIRLYCKKVLEDSGYEVVIAENGIEALKKLDETEVDVMISDIQMPEMDGLTLVKMIRENRKNFTLPIILITSLESETEVKAGLEAGANAYIRKSAFSQKELIALMKKVIPESN